MPEPDERGRALAPQVTEPDVVAVLVGQHDVCELVHAAQSTDHRYLLVMPKLLWEPSDERVARATLTRYTAWLERSRGLRFDDYAQLWEWSVSDLDAFWSSIVEFFGVRFAEGGDVVLGRREMPGAEWFPGAVVSFAEHIFAGKDDDALAIQHASELRPLDSWTWAELRSETARIAAGLRASGVGSGDRVVAYMPNIPETVAAFLACASIGAVWSSAAPEFGARSVIDRFAQVEPKVLLAVDGYRYGGKDFDRGEMVERIASAIPSLERVVRLGYLDGSGWEDGFLGEGADCRSRSSRSITRYGCCTARARPGCRSRSSMGRAGS